MAAYFFSTKNGDQKSEQFSWIQEVWNKPIIDFPTPCFRDDQLRIFPLWQKPRTISISVCSPIACLSHNSYDMPGLAPLMNVLFSGRCNFQISFSDRNKTGNDCNRVFGRTMVATGMLLNKTKTPLPNVACNLGTWPQWHPPLIRHYTNSWPSYRAWPYYYWLTYFEHQIRRLKCTIVIIRCPSSAVRSSS